MARLMFFYTCFIAPFVMLYDQISDLIYAFTQSFPHVSFKILAFVLIIIPSYLNWKHMFKCLGKPTNLAPESRLTDELLEKCFRNNKYMRYLLLYPLMAFLNWTKLIFIYD